MSKEPTFDPKNVNEHADYLAAMIGKHTPALARAARDLAAMVHLLSRQLHAQLHPPPIVIVVESEEARAKLLDSFKKNPPSLDHNGLTRSRVTPGGLRHLRRAPCWLSGARAALSAGWVYGKGSPLCSWTPAVFTAVSCLASRAPRWLAHLRLHVRV